MEISKKNTSEFKVRLLLMRGADPFSKREYLSGFKASLMAQKYNVSRIILSEGSAADCSRIEKIISEFDSSELQKNYVSTRVDVLCNR